MTSLAALARKIGLPLAVMAACLLIANSAMAAEEGATWRPIYDRIMLVINFLILVAIVVKFGKGPIKEFLTNRQFDVANEIEQLEKQKEELKKETETTEKKLDDSRAHFAEISDRIIESGETAKQSIIADAKNQSQLMLEDAKRKIQAQIAAARQNFRSELIDTSIDLALQNIKGHMTPEDEQRFVDQYVSTLPNIKP